MFGLGLLFGWYLNIKYPDKTLVEKIKAIVTQSPSPVKSIASPSINSIASPIASPSVNPSVNQIASPSVNPSPSQSVNPSVGIESVNPSMTISSPSVLSRASSYINSVSF
jgi:hypothetical protein